MRILNLALSSALLFLFAGGVGCAAAPRVVRVYDGRVTAGSYVSPEGYASFLRGALAEEDGDFTSALAAFAESDSDPEVLSRVGALQCRLAPKDAVADRTFARAFSIDPNYASSLRAKAVCELGRGHDREASSLAERAAVQDPQSASVAAVVVRAAASSVGPAARARAITRTEAHADRAEAWDALLAWGRGHRDAELIARAFEGLVRAAPARSFESERGALALLEASEHALAQRVAVAVADAPRQLGVRGPRDATVARLAVDEALARGDVASALLRATRGHVSVEEVSARAFALDQRSIAASLAREVTAADPSASGAQMVTRALAFFEHTGRRESLAVTSHPPEICALVFASSLALSAGTQVANQWLRTFDSAPMAAHDPLAGALATALVERGVLSVESLPANARSRRSAPFQPARASE